MKAYVLMISSKFPLHHPRAGNQTGFLLNIIHKEKIHTIRGNYELWEKRFQEIEKGNAYLSLRIWEGVPYKSKQRQICGFDKAHGIGIQKLQRKNNVLIESRHYLIDGVPKPNLTTKTIANNDGLGVYDFMDWFKGGFGVEPKVIIHFTKFRY